MERYADGDDGAFAAVYDAVERRVTGFVQRQVRDPALVEDIVQQTFLNLHRARGTFVRGGAVVPWALAIARRLMIDLARQRRLVLMDELPDVHDDRTPERVVHARRAVDLAAATLARLPAGQRDAFALVKQEGMSHAEAAVTLGTSTTAVKLRVHRVGVALRSLLGLNDGSGREE